MKKYDPEVRVAQRTAYCRACDGTIKVGESMLSWYSIRNRGQNIHIHLECAVRMGDDAKDELTRQSNN